MMKKHIQKAQAIAVKQQHNHKAWLAAEVVRIRDEAEKQKSRIDAYAVEQLNLLRCLCAQSGHIVALDACVICGARFAPAAQEKTHG